MSKKSTVVKFATVQNKEEKSKGGITHGKEII